MAKILIAEDDAVARDLLEHVLRQEGFEPLPALDGDTAFALAKKEMPDLILLDVMMPYTDGLEVLRRLKESPELKNIPVIMLTAKSGDSDITVGFDMGATDYVVKPFSLGELLARVRKSLREAKSTKTPVPES
jgi:DNA-binding response OmpR family regulator